MGEGSMWTTLGVALAEICGEPQAYHDPHFERAQLHRVAPKAHLPSTSVDNGESGDRLIGKSLRNLSQAVGRIRLSP
jgi:hypothetical protein